MSEQADRDDELRAMAQHRGFKLLKSRRRKPGAGDYGRFGLSDAAGKPVIGVGPNGLTALPDEIEAYLRTGAANSWKASAQVTPSQPKRAKKAAVVNNDAATLPRSEDLGREPQPRGSKAHSGKPTGQNNASPNVRSALEAPTRQVGSPASKRPVRPIIAEPPPPAALVLREPKKRDATVLADLLSELSAFDRSATEVAKDIAAIRKAGGGLLLADRGGLIGCISWTLVTTVHRGPIGRITVILVTAKERRKGVGRRLVEGALAALEEAGCTSVEAMSDIDIRNAHGFFRSLDFAQASYRFTRSTAQSGT